MNANNELLRAAKWAHDVMTGHRASWSVDEPNTAAETLRLAIAAAEQAQPSEPAPTMAEIDNTIVRLTRAARIEGRELDRGSAELAYATEARANEQVYLVRLIKRLGGAS